MNSKGICKNPSKTPADVAGPYSLTLTIPAYLLPRGPRASMEREPKKRRFVGK